MRLLTVSDTMTDFIRVHIESIYMPERSSPADDRFFFAYNVRISNEGPQSAQLLSRHWIITDALGRREEVKGPGVIGEQPYLRPGESFEYNSFCPLPTSSGTMRGVFNMIRDDGARFEAVIGEFKLIVDYILN